MIIGIVSGGQTGADQAGLRAARKLGLKTGGFCPHGFVTEAGPQAWLGPTYGLVETATEDYSERTEMNVTISTGTVIFGSPSAGSNLTQQLCKELEKPCLWLKEYQQVSAQAHFRLWAERNHITVLNVAGNRERKSPGIGIAVERFLIEAISQMKGCDNPGTCGVITDIGE